MLVLVLVLVPVPIPVPVPVPRRSASGCRSGHHSTASG
jgi:hypothetical protein